MKSKWVEFRLIGKGYKTSTWNIHHIKSGEYLGTVRWYPQWRQYCYFPYKSVFCEQLVFSQGCLKDIAVFIKKQMNKRKKHYCGECYFRDYGTDSHYVCQEGDESNWFRVRKDSPACDHFKRKE